jgi:hypothetical protein
MRVSVAPTPDAGRPVAEGELVTKPVIRRADDVAALLETSKLAVAIVPLGIGEVFVPQMTHSTELAPVAYKSVLPAAVTAAAGAKLMPLKSLPE